MCRQVQTAQSVLVLLVDVAARPLQQLHHPQVVPESCVVDGGEAESVPAVHPGSPALDAPSALFQVDTFLVAGEDVVDDIDVAVIGSHVKEGTSVVVEQSLDILEVVVDELLRDVVLLTVADAFEQPPLHSNQIMNRNQKENATNGEEIGREGMDSGMIETGVK